MNTSIRYPLFLFLASALLIGVQSCKDRAIEKLVYTANVPVYAESLDKTIVSSEPRTIDEQGKIHIRGSQIFIVKPQEGIHVLDNSNPKAPVNVAFIEVPGAIDVSTNGSVMYVDSYFDLVTLDISDVKNVSEVDRDEDVFKQALPATGNDYPMLEVDTERGIVIGWVLREVETTSEIDFNNRWLENTGEQFFTADALTNSGTTSSVTFQTGVSGSLARFIVLDNALYTVNSTEIQVYDLSNQNNPTKGNTVNVNRDVETLFPTDGKLFVGTTTGMVVYGLNNPLNPSYISNFNHSTACDPVVVDGDFAYVTLRGGTACGGFRDQLDVLDISDISQPNRLASYNMTGPYGLGIDGNTLFICDGNAGLKVFDATDKYKIDENLIAQYSSIIAYDVIPLNGLLLVIAEDGFYQYDYSDLTNIQLLSSI